MTDEQIEREVERRFNRLDHLFINRKAMNQAEYDRQARAIGDWAEYQYAVLEAVQLLNWKERRLLGR